MWLHCYKAVASAAAAGSVATVDAAGDPVVTHMSVYFSLIASLLPHLALQHWQQQLLGQLQPQLLQVGCDGFCAGMSILHQQKRLEACLCFVKVFRHPACCCCCCRACS
jgi:hypothetical protein